MGKMVTITGNQAAAHVAYAFSEVAAIYPITPSSDMGEFVDAWSAQGLKNMWGQPVAVAEMQSEAGAAGAVHGSLSAGAFTTTFTASQGLFLMIPNMYKIAGEMIPTVFHVSARAIACQSLAIFGDHSDVMSVRNTGFALLSATSIQEVMDLSLVAHLATLESQIPFLSFFDGFRTSHEIQKVEEIAYEDMKKLVNPEYIQRFRERGMRPEKPYIKVASQNPDVYFQGRETVNPYYEAVPEIVQKYMDQVAKITGRPHKIFDYYGAADADRVIVSMGSSCDAIEETVDYLNAKGEKVGVLKVHLYRPFSAKHFLSVLPKSVKKIAVLDRTKEPGSLGEPLYQDVVTVIADQPEFANVKVVGGRYGLSSKEFNPSMVLAVYKHLNGKCFHDFTVGINDDVTGRSLVIDEEINTDAADVTGCIFWGLGSDGTVGANKDTIKIIGDNTDMYAQGYFVYDSKKSYGITISHLRFGKSKIRSPYVVSSPKVVACHNPSYIGRYAMLENIQEGGIFLLNSSFSADEAFDHLSKDLQEAIINKKLKFYNIDALAISKENGLGARINSVMATAFFHVSGVLPSDTAIELYKKAIAKTFKKKGEEVIQKNWQCVDAAIAALQEIKVPATITKSFEPAPLLPADADKFAKEIIEPTVLLKGDSIPVSKMSFDGSLPSGTSRLEKRRIAPEVPHWISDKCIQCNQCVNACPHATIRAKLVTTADLAKAPASFNTVDMKPKAQDDLKYKLQIYCDDCTGCGVCLDVCPVKALEMVKTEDERAAGEVENYEFFDALPDNELGPNKISTVKGAGFLKPLFEFSGACSGCGETPYVRLMSQLFGERMVASNATGCSSIYSGTFPTVPYCKTKEGRGPTWANSLFEDNAENGFGMRLAIDANREQLKANAEQLVKGGLCHNETVKAAIAKCLTLWDKTDAEAIKAQDEAKAALAAAASSVCPEAKEVFEKVVELQDYFVDKSVWIIGGDGWAYDIGFGGLDHVVASGRNINILVLDTEVYSNTGGQASKSTPIGAVAKFASAGKRKTKKNLGFMCMSYGDVYVASCAMGANRQQTLNAFIEAEAHKGPSILMCYAPCIAHGINMSKTQTEQKRAVACGYWPLYRFNPAAEKKFNWETPAPTAEFQEFIRSENRYKALLKASPDAEALFAQAEEDAKRRMEFYQKMGEIM